MQLRLEAARTTWRAGETVRVRLLALNESYEPVALERGLLVGPNPVAEPNTGMPLPVSLEPPARKREHNVVLLNPWCLYGREREFQFSPGRVTIYGFLLERAVAEYGAQGPADAGALAVAAEPLVLTIE